MKIKDVFDIIFSMDNFTMLFRMRPGVGDTTGMSCGSPMTFGQILMS